MESKTMNLNYTYIARIEVFEDVVSYKINAVDFLIIKVWILVDTTAFAT
jgi:hypothetical protein